MKRPAVVAMVVLAICCAVARAATPRLPELDKADLVEAIRAQEQAVNSLRCRATLTYLMEEDWSEAHLADPAAAPWDSSVRVHQLEWAFDGSPDKGKLYESNTGVIPVMEDAVGELAKFLGRYGHMDHKTAFNGEYQTELRGTGGLLTPDEIRAGAGVRGRSGVIRSERPMQRQSLHTLHAYSFWTVGQPLSDLLESGEATLVGEDEVEGRPAYRVNIPKPDSGTELRLWLDPQRGFAMARLQEIALYPEERPWSETLDVELAEWSPGFWFARKIVGGSALLKNLWKLEFEDVQVNGPIEDSLFTVDFPPRTWLRDERAGIEYMVGLSERELEQMAKKAMRDIERELARGPVPPDPEAAAESPPDTAPNPAILPVASQASAARRPWGAYLIAAAAGAVILLLGILVGRRVRRAA